jgi:hypothetical protein
MMNINTSHLIRITATAMCALIGACAPAPKVPTQKPDASSATQSGGSAGANLGTVKDSITPAVLESGAMRLNMTGVVKFEFGKNSFPAVNFVMPAQADYVQVIRCRSDANLGELTQIEIGSNNTAASNSKYMEKDYWKSVAGNAFCAYITTGSSVESVVDFYANTGDYIYVARACVEKSRLTITDGSDDTNFCSRQIAVTTVFRGHVNKAKKLSAEKKESLRAQRDSVDAMGREMVYLAKQADGQLSECEKRRFANEVSKRKRAALGKLLGIGINLGAQLMGDGMAKSVVSGIGSNFQSIFEGLTAQVGDFLPADFCPGYDLTFQKMTLLKQRLDTESNDYNERVALFGEP